MEPSSLIDDAEFLLPPEFLTDEDFLVEKENKFFNGIIHNHGGIDEFNKCLFPCEPSHGFGSFRLNSGFGSSVKPNLRSSEFNVDEENFLAGLTRQMVQSSLEDEFTGGYGGNINKAWGTTRSPQSTLCGAGFGCTCRNQRLNQNCQSRVSSQAAWELYCAAAEEVARININDELYGYNNRSGIGLLDLPRKHSVAAVKNPDNGGSGYYSHESLPYQKLQAIQFQQLKQQQLMKHHHQLVQQSRGGLRASNNKNGGSMDLSSSAWSHQPPRRDASGMRAVFLGDHTGKRSSTGTGVFLPRSVNHTSPATTETRKKPTLATVLVPARVAQVLNLNLDKSVVQPIVRSSASLNDASWRQQSNNGGFSSHMKMEQPVNEPRLPSEWAY